ncbi:MAG: relaxase/mobilization nuclease domain-containing protein [Sphingomonadaceae bacterium]|nr:relaxase/mobilization nuclease domain-containing protein [Sphingomonadaceae bacterium]MBJ7526269.1 relaxase/mobilization nuclease domain-containing protein [Sphingomonadaceae bacterium]
MIVNKIKRKAVSGKTGAADMSYLSLLTRYIARADVVDLKHLAQASDDQYLRDLSRYALAPGKLECVVASGAKNLFGAELADWQTEMIALSHRCPKSANALDHWVISWQETENPTPQEVERSVELFLRAQGLQHTPTVWALHRDTDNPHAHIAVLKIDPVTAKRVEAGDGWDIDAGHRGLALIEAEFPHFQRETGALYSVTNGDLIDNRTKGTVGPADEPSKWQRFNRKSTMTEAQDKALLPIKSADKRLGPASTKYESETGYQSRERIALEVAVPILLAAKSWNEAHNGLAKAGISIEKRRTGAVFLIGGIAVKASISRQTSLVKLEQRYREPMTESPYAAAEVAPREIYPNDLIRRQYYAAKRAHAAAVVSAANDVKHVIGRSSQLTAQKAAFAAATGKLAFPDFDAWLRGKAALDPMTIFGEALGLDVIFINNPKLPTGAPNSVVGFTPLVLGNRTLYYRDGDPLRATAFTDLGDKILIKSGQDRAAIRASILLLAERHPGATLTATGSREFRKLALQIAAQEGVALEQRTLLTGLTKVRDAAAERIMDALPPSPPRTVPVTSHHQPPLRPLQNPFRIPPVNEKHTYAEPVTTRPPISVDTMARQRRMMQSIARRKFAKEWQPFAYGGKTTVPRDAEGALVRDRIALVSEMPNLPGTTPPTPVDTKATFAQRQAQNAAIQAAIAAGMGR